MTIADLPELGDVDTMLRRGWSSEASSSDDTRNVALGDGATVRDGTSGASFFRPPVHRLATGALPKSSDDGYGTCSDDSTAGHAGRHYPHYNLNVAQHHSIKIKTSMSDDSLQPPHFTTAKYSCGSSGSWYMNLGVKEFNRACKKRKVSGKLKQMYQKARRRAQCRGYAIRGRQKQRENKNKKS